MPFDELTFPILDEIVEIPVWSMFRMEWEWKSSVKLNKKQFQMHTIAISYYTSVICTLKKEKIEAPL